MGVQEDKLGGTMQRLRFIWFFSAEKNKKRRCGYLVKIFISLNREKKKKEIFVVNETYEAVEYFFY